MGTTNWDLYENRIEILGLTRRDRNVNKIKNDINIKISGSPSCQSVTYNADEDTSNLIILDVDNNPYEKKINALPDESFDLGDIVNWMSQYWLITKIDVDNTIQVSGYMQLCNYNLKFLDSDGVATSRYCIIGDSSGSVEENNFIRLGNGKYSIKLAFDSETKLFKDGGRFLIDYNTTEPLAYKIIRVDSVVNNYGTSGGMIILTVEQDGRNVSDDSVALMIANYYSKVSSAPTVHTANYCEISYVGNSTLKVGAEYKKYTAAFKTKTGTLITPIPTPVWTLSSNSQYISHSATSNYILIKITDISLLGNNITLSLKDSLNTMNTSLVLGVLPLG